MKNKLLFTALIAVILLLISGYFQKSPPPSYPDSEDLVGILRSVDPQIFWETLIQSDLSSSIDSRYISTTLLKLKKAAPFLPLSDRLRIDAVEGILLTKMNFFQAALPRLLYSLDPNDVSDEDSGISLAIKQILNSIEDPSTLKNIPTELLPEKHLKTIHSQNKENLPKPDNYQKSILAGFWIFILLLPFFIIENERRACLEKTIEFSNSRGPYLAFSNSLLPEILLLLSGIVFLISDLPAKLGYKIKIEGLIIHLFIVWLLSQYSQFKLDRQIKNLETSYFSFLKEKITRVIFTHLHSISIVFALAIVVLLVHFMPLWALLNPYSAIMSTAILFSFILLSFEFFAPLLFMLKRGKSLFPYRLYSTVFGANKGVLEYGSLSFLRTVIYFGNLEKHLSDQEFHLLSARSNQRMQSNQFFIDYLISLNFILVISLFFSRSMLSFVRFFSSGPTFIEAFAILTLIILCGWFRKTIRQSSELLADEKLSNPDLYEHLISILEKINRLNFLPEHLREGERTFLDTLSLKEVKDNLRSIYGKYYTESHPPKTELIAALWRSRLALEWKLGIQEAVFVASLDYQLNSATKKQELQLLAQKHLIYGSQSLHFETKEQLNILYCHQKSVAASSEAQLPQDKICEICSQAMLSSLRHGPYEWIPTPKGCKLIRVAKPE